MRRGTHIEAGLNLFAPRLRDLLPTLHRERHRIGLKTLRKATTSIDGQHLAKIFIGQFHLQVLDPEFFRRQALECGFDATDYLSAIQEVPVISEAKLHSLLGFLSGFAKMLGSFSLERRRAFKTTEAVERRTEELRRSQAEALSLAEDAEQARCEILRDEEPSVDLRGKKSYLL